MQRPLEIEALVLGMGNSGHVDGNMRLIVDIVQTKLYMSLSSYLYDYTSIITVIVALPSMRPSLVTFTVTVFAGVQKCSNIELLAVNDVHSLISVVQVVPARRLVRRITCPHVTKIVGMLSLRTVNPTISPRTSSDVGALGVFELVHCCSDDGLRMGLLAKGRG